MKEIVFRFFTRISFIILAFMFISQIPVSASPAAADDLADVFVYLPIVSKNYVSGEGTVWGYVIDAQTGNPLRNVDICYKLTYCDTTDSTGKYTLENIPDGVQYLTADAAGYLLRTKLVFVQTNSSVQLDFSLLPQLKLGEFRIVLTWSTTPSWPPNNYPNDLNLHMWADDYDAHLYFAFPGDCGTIELTPPYACYENNEQYGSGPDTILLVDKGDDYKFAVLNYYDEYTGVPAITESGAHVEVFSSTSSDPINTFDVPTAGDGDLWYVFDLLNGVVEPRGCLLQYPLGGTPSPLCP